MNNTIISNKVLDWYDNNKRELPWRKPKSKKQNQYFTLVSEFMLQQTQVKTVIPYFEKFTKNFPNLKTLAQSSEKKILKNWEGLGYYSRAKNLKKTAIKLLKDFNGELPVDINKLKSLPGIGDYTSTSILAIAHNKPYIPMDGNVERILKRVFLLKNEIEISKENLNKKKNFFGFSRRASDYAQAIMEIGALICKPITPSCSNCPLIDNCKAHEENDFFIKPKKKFNKIKYFEASVFKFKNKYLLIKNRKFNFLKNFIIFPMIEINQKKFEFSSHKKINVKMSNMNMKIIINNKNKIKMTKESFLIDKSNFNNYILSSFTKKIFNSVSN